MFTKCISGTNESAVSLLLLKIELNLFIVDSNNIKSTVVDLIILSSTKN